MTNTCFSCRRPVPLTADEIAVLSAAARSGAGIRTTELPAGQAACVRALVRLGYLVTVANDDGPRGKIALLTDHGRGRLAEMG